jgi:hypothetical protein
MSNFQSNKTDGSESLFGEVIFSYTRAQAIADRVLIDVTPTALEAGFRFPVATTAALMAAVETIEGHKEAVSTLILDIEYRTRGHPGSSDHNRFPADF